MVLDNACWSVTHEAIESSKYAQVCCTVAITHNVIAMQLNRPLNVFCPLYGIASGMDMENKLMGNSYFCLCTNDTFS